jgi:thiol-disulfide isomerase/thioredoxin
MRVQLLVSEWCAPCRAADEVWRRVAEEKAISFEVLDVAQPEGRAVVAPRGIRTVPATVIDGELKHVGVPSRGEALQLVAAAPERAPSSLRHVGLTLEPTSRAAIAAAALYLALAASALVLAGGIVGDPPWRPAAVHVFGLGFVSFFIFGLGEHLLPRFTGAPIRMGAAAWLQQLVGHAGTLLLASGLYGGSRSVALGGGVLAWLALALFAARLWPVLWPGATAAPSETVV